MRKILSACLSAALILGCVATAPVNATAEEIAVQNSGDSYRDEFISALLETEDEWLGTDYRGVHCLSKIMFIDLNFDGNLELISQIGGGSMGNCTANICYLENGKVMFAEETNEYDYKFANSVAFHSRGLEAYYDTVKQDYKYLSSYDVTGLGFQQTNSFKGSFYFDGKTISSDIYSECISKTDENGNIVEEYHANDGVVSKEEYEAINAMYTENCVNANMSYDYIEQTDFINLSDTEKKATLERLYDSFTYDKYEYNDTDSTTDTDEEPVVLNYTATDLVNKTILEIIEIMGGEFEVDSLYDLPSGLVYIYNEEKLPGMHFYLGGDSFYDENHGGVKLDDIKNGKYPLNTIRIFGTGKLDENVSADMSYNDLTKYFGDFECQIAQFLGGSVCDEKVLFRFDSTGFSTENPNIGVEELKEKNPKLNDIVVYPGYDPTIDTDTNSDTDTSTDTDTNSDTDTSTDTDTTSDTDTSNNTDSDKNTSSNTSSNTTSKNNTTNNKTNNTTTTTTTTTTATVATNGITNIFVFIGVLAVSSIAIIYVVKKRKEN